MLFFINHPTIKKKKVLKNLLIIFFFHIVQFCAWVFRVKTPRISAHCDDKQLIIILQIIYRMWKYIGYKKQN